MYNYLNFRTMKTRVVLFGLSLSIGLFFASCDGDDDSSTKTVDSEKPVISGLVVGHKDSIHVGEDVHLEFEVTDNEALDYYKIDIHPEEENHAQGRVVGVKHWEFDSTFTEISGLKNMTVHHHKIVVPSDAELGKYHFHLVVADKAGNTSEAEKDVIVAVGDGEGHGNDHGHK